MIGMKNFYSEDNLFICIIYIGNNIMFGSKVSRCSLGINFDSVQLLKCLRIIM